MPIAFEFSSDDISVTLRGQTKKVATRLHSKTTNRAKVKKEKDDKAKKEKEGNALFGAFVKIMGINGKERKGEVKQKDGSK
jgi:hypothetical protein